MECILFNTIHNHDALFVVDFVEADFDNFGIGGFDGAADEAGLDGQFAMAAVDEHAKADAARTAEIEEAVHCGAYGAAGIENVVDKQQISIINGERNFARLDNGLRGDGGKIVAIESDVESADRDFRFGGGANGFRKALGERDAAAANADEREILCAAGFFDDFMRQTFEGAANFVRGHELALLDDAHRTSYRNTGRKKRESTAREWATEGDGRFDGVAMDSAGTMERGRLLCGEPARKRPAAHGR